MVKNQSCVFLKGAALRFFFLGLAETGWTLLSASKRCRRDGFCLDERISLQKLSIKLSFKASQIHGLRSIIITNWLGKFSLFLSYRELALLANVLATAWFHRRADDFREEIRISWNTGDTEPFSDDVTAWRNSTELIHSVFVPVLIYGKRLTGPHRAERDRRSRKKQRNHPQ